MAFSFAFDEDKYNLHGRPFYVPENRPSKQTSQDVVVCGFENLKITVLDKSYQRTSLSEITVKRLPNIQY